MSSNDDTPLTGLLAELKDREDGFRTPAPDYFDALADQAIAANKQPARRRLIPAWSYAAAACFALLVAAFLLWPNGGYTGSQTAVNGSASTPTVDELLADLSEEEITGYLEAPTTDLETDIFTGYLPQTTDDDF